MFDFNDNKDTFCEQLVSMKKDFKYYALFFGIWALAFLIVYFAVLISFAMPNFMALIVLVVFGAFYGAVKLTGKLFVEYEYIVVNREMDIDKITGKSSRKRLVSIKLNNVEEFGFYNEAIKNNLSHRKIDVTYNCANFEAETFYMIVKHPKKGTVLIVAEFNERLLEAVKRSIPKISQKF